MDENKKISANKQKKIDIVADLNQKLAKAKAVIFTNYQGITHKQLETLKKAIKPLDAEYVVAKNSLVLRALDENKIKLEGENPLEGPTGTMLIYADVIGPLKQLAKTIKELGIPSVKLGIMENKFLTGEQVLKISTLPSRETLLAQIAAGLKSPISGLHRALNWNLQKLVMTLGAVAKAKPVAALVTEPVAEVKEEPKAESAVETPAVEAEPETILAATVQEKKAEQPETQATTKNTNETQKSEGGEN
jgi:large subunit ribosomal protein L10